MNEDSTWILENKQIEIRLDDCKLYDWTEERKGDGEAWATDFKGKVCTYLSFLI